MKRALVLGGGIQGCCVALMLEKHGYEVNVVDKSKDIINRASFNQEGKIHLGLVYGMDRSLKTAKKLLLDALYFAPYFEYLIGKNLDWEKLKSTNFNYLVAKDSLLSPEEVEAYFQNLQTIYDENLKNEKLTYLGRRPKKLFKKISLPEEVNPDFFQACFATEETSLNQKNFKKIIKEKIQSRDTGLSLSQQVTSAKRTKTGFRVETRSKNGDVQHLESDVVVNCLWEGKMALDKEMGMKVEKGHNFRIKYGIIVKSQDPLQGLSSFTMIQGPYGDYVNFPQSQETYFCWYPSCMKGMVIDQKLPQSWEDACEGNIPDSIKQSLVNENFDQFRQLIPALDNFQVVDIKAGLIVAKGQQDIDNQNSKLHERSESPITEQNGYFSINTGKFTSAPHNAYLLEKILGYDDFFKDFE